MESDKEMSTLAAKKDILAGNSAPSLAVLKYFSQLPGATLSEMTTGPSPEQYSVIQATVGDWVGTGRGESRFLSTLKAVAECFERRFFDEYIEANRKSIPQYKRNSNGFAVHFNPAEAKTSAIREAIERHILQITFLKHGWDGFYLFGSSVKNDLRITQVISKYQVNGYTAGLVLAQSNKFLGVAFGYFCDSAEHLKHSERWFHAEAEAIDKIEPILNLAKANSLNAENSIDREMFRWFFEPFQIPEFKGEFKKHDLPDIDLNVEIFDLQKLWNLDFPFHAAKCDGDKLLPLLIPQQNFPTLDLKLTQLFEIYQIDSGFPQRNPIL
jgi:hypothetical protein